MNILVTFIFVLFQYSIADKPSFKICVPTIVLPACNSLMSKQSDIADIQCIAGRDRVDCLSIVEKRLADFMAVDPEDLYLAFKKKNEDYTVFSDIRTTIEQGNEFRYEGIILIKKNSGINSLQDMRGKKSCHTGYARNVGYKIPIAKLKKHGIFKVDNDASLSPVERELKALSEMFNQSCLVGNYSGNAEVNERLKKTYPNLCALCENPAKCDYPDIYSGYDGSIRCLVQNGGDIAFTKTIYVNKFFGLPIGNAAKAVTESQANAEDYEYLCEDGKKVPITSKPCTWAQRPWQAYMGNGDIASKQLEKLQRRLENFYNSSKSDQNEAYKKQMMVDSNNTVVAKSVNILPGLHLTNAKYMDVIEREMLDGDSDDEKLKLCVSSNIEMRKCEMIRDVAFSRDIRPKFQCIEKDKENCKQALIDGSVDIVVVQASDYKIFADGNLKPLIFEAFSEDENYVIIADQSATKNDFSKGTIKFDTSNRRSFDAALHFSKLRPGAQSDTVCPNNIKNDPNGKFEVVNSKDLGKFNSGKRLVCKNMESKALSEYKTCNFDSTLATAVYVRKTLKTDKVDSIKHVFNGLSEKFGHQARLEDVFELFGTFEEGQANVIFNDEAAKFVTQQDADINEAFYDKLRCAK